MPCPSCKWPDLSAIYREPDGKMFAAAPGAKVATEVTRKDGTTYRVCEATDYFQCHRCAAILVLAGTEIRMAGQAETEAVRAALEKSLGNDRNWTNVPGQAR